MVSLLITQALPSAVLIRESERETESVRECGKQKYIKKNG
jgi:hypothetical protein